ncbi:MAG: hypothetical protein AB7G93_08860 [Bdellovibrionales bacterium]
MSKIIMFLLLFTGAQAFAQTEIDKKACQQEYKDSITTCAHSLNELPKGMRAGAQKACVEDAKIQKKLCQSGVNLCLDNCQAVYNSAVSTCNLSFDPATCGGSPACELIVNELRASCISDAVNALNACTAACPQ